MPASKPNICLLHGWEASVQKLAPMTQALKKNGFNPYTPKLPYFDLPEPSKPWSNQDFAQFITQKCAQNFKGQPYYLFGHSFGGRLTIKIAQNNPKFLKGIILCSSAGVFRDPLIKRAFFKLLSLTFKPLKKNRLLTKILVKLTGSRDYSQITSLNKKQTFKNIIAENQQNQVKQIRLPSLIIWGQRDKITPLKSARFLNRHLKNSKLIIIPSARHAIPYTHSDKIVKLISSWINSLSSN